MRKLNERFKQMKKGSFIKQGINVGYLDENAEIVWIRHMGDETKKEITPFL